MFRRWLDSRRRERVFFDLQMRWNIISSTMFRKTLVSLMFAAAVMVQSAAQSLPRAPQFELDPKWPEIPNNWVLGEVTSISVEGERARVRISSAPPLVAEVTLASVQRLGLRDGVVTWASFKAVEVEILPA